MLVHSHHDSSRLDRLALPRRLSKVSADVTRIPFHRVPLLMPRPYAVTVHDLSSIFFDDASAWEFPNDNVVVFPFNPFGPDIRISFATSSAILRRRLERTRASS